MRGPFEFDFRVQVYTGKVLELDQSVESDGTTVTLERVVVTPVETRIILRGVGPNAAATLEAGRSEYRLSPRGAVPLQWTPGSAWSYSSPENLVNEKGEWVVTVTPGPPVPPDVAPSVPVVTGGPWIFRFTLP